MFGLQKLYLKNEHKVMTKSRTASISDCQSILLTLKLLHNLNLNSMQRRRAGGEAGL